jgi:hypothetical protein
MSKEIQKKECSECESNFKLVFSLDETSGYPKFCPFCGCDIYDEEEPHNEEDDD